ncbi:class I SAM-dependent DNA methyltransferase [Scatolibacter rhodanostii]|uniref:class I SAM-dependent DNA methyltransferase n=1 Tax=Scatolibacter rhodanostii TaxID=2014781 RepID=UPI000C0747ED|nr:class I SAM-dependent methyltransferase [Scatolibacter rhodanostii]
MSYSQFAFYYDDLTQNVDYPARARYFLNLLEKVGHEPGLTLDLACGTGSLTLALAVLNVDVFGVDISPEMLMQAKDKAYDVGKDILFLQQPMQNLDLYGTVDTVICALDSINHLKNSEQVKKTFSRVHLFLNKDGCFVFDVNTPYKHRNILANNTFVYDVPSVYCVWQNFLKQDDSVEISLDFFEKQGTSYIRSSEHFFEQTYEVQEIKDMLQEAGFKNIAVYDELSFEEPRDNSQRLVFVCQKTEE